MSLDRPTRNALARMVGQARERLKREVMDQLRRLGFQADGSVLDLQRIAGLSDEERVAGAELRALLDHLVALESGPDATRRQAAYDRLVREIGFTTLNRLAALRMAEERGLIVQAVGRGLASDGFQVYERLANGGLGSRAETYRAYVECLYDELVLDLPGLFDRKNPESRIFPRERCLDEVLAMLNDPNLAHLWKEDETIGWIYQYYNDPEERRKMRESAAPRNSRELAVRNQFFTPRYVVELLTDNTLGRLWYEMRRGETRLADQCRYLVRRAHTVFLDRGQEPPRPFHATDPWGDPDDPGEIWVRPNPELADNLGAIWRYALTVGGYDDAREQLGVGCADLANERLKKFRETKTWEGTFEELRCCLLFEQRRYHHVGDDPSGEDLDAIRALYRTICERWDLDIEHVPFRPKKDPRDLRILDPACGSGHFLLYAFDLLETIYEEAWADAASPPSRATGRRLRDDYPDLDALRRAVPGLILRHNLHGIDIDPRACQIAGLALWLRAQHSYQRLGLKPAERPPITRSNVVCAEPMPGERDMLEEYLRTVDERLRPLVRVIWKTMQLAGDAGSLLKIEDEIAEAVERARAEALDVPPVQVTLHQDGMTARQMVLDLVSDDDRAFWSKADQELLRALRDYAGQATNGGSIRRRLFAGDAAQGFAFVDLCRERFDVVLMNPPFGEGSSRAKSYVERAYPRTKNDVYAAFVERWLGRLEPRGLLGAITSRTGFFLSSFQKWREEILLREARIVAFADLGFGVLDSAMVETAAYCLERIVEA
jgi:hypothetical protein